MATVTHAKTIAIPDPTQAELDAQIALGNYPVGTTLADIALGSDFNAAHIFALGADENFLTDVEYTDLTDAGDSTLHFHSADRARMNHTGTQTASTISDFSEAVDDRAAALIQNGTGIAWTYDDIANTLTGNVSITQYTDELAQDATGAMVSGNTETLIAVTYDDAGNKLNFAVEPNLSNYTNDAGFLTANQTITLSGDVTGSGTTGITTTLATVNANVGSFGSSTSIPSFTVNAKGLITAASGNAVIAPAGTLTGATLAANVLASSLTSVGTITTGVWNGTDIAVADGGTGASTASGARTNLGLVIDTDVAATSFKTIAVAGQSDVVADSATDTLTLVAGANITMTTNAGTDTVTIAATGGGTPGDGDYGDITVSSSGTVWTIDNDVVTFAKMQNIATDRLLGRDTALTGDVEEISLNATLEFTGAAAIQRAALTGAITASAGSNTTALGSFSSADLRGALTDETGTGAAYFAGGDIGTPSAGVLTNCTGLPTAGLLDDAVTYAKIQNVSATSRILGRITAGAGDVEELTAANVVTIINSSLDHGALTGLTDDDHTQYALLAGRSGGQTLIGGTAASNNLDLQSTSNATRGFVRALDTFKSYRNDTSTDPSAYIEQDSTGDATLAWLLTAGQEYRAYIDNSDTDSFKLDDQTNTRTFLDYDPATDLLTVGATVGNVVMGGSTETDWYAHTHGKVNFGTAINAINNIFMAGKVKRYNDIATVNGGVPYLVATIDTTGLQANVSASTLYSVPASGEGMYRVNVQVVLTTAASISSTLPNVQLVYTDKDSNVSVTLDVTPILGAAGSGQTGALTANTVGTLSCDTKPIYVKASTTIQYKTVNYASTAAGMTYALRIKLESMV